MAAPKLFISYSWTNPDHEQWVINLATELRESGVDVILDKWDLKEGNDAYAFMEKMVSDPEIKKVAIICDEKYTTKANGRHGGVGTETQIISREVYENQDQNKFVAVVKDRDTDGKAFLPTYYKSRIYIDLSEVDKYTENFERLLRWIFDKPLFIKPEIGKRPDFLADGPHVSLGTSAISKRCIDAVKNQKSHAIGIFNEYCELFSNNLERFRIDHKVEGEFDDAVIKSITEFTPFRNEFIQTIITIAQYAIDDKIIQRVHRFFENIIQYMHRPENISSYYETDYDNFRFVIHELFLYTLAILIKYEKFEYANYLMNNKYYNSKRHIYGGDTMLNFTVFREYTESIQNRSSRLNLRRLSLRADLLKERSISTGINFQYLMQADFIAFMRSEISSFGGWWPETLLYVGHFGGEFEVFARSVSKQYFEKVKILLNIQNPQDLTTLFAQFASGERRLPRWDFNSFSPFNLVGYKNLATQP